MLDLANSSMPLPCTAGGQGKLADFHRTGKAKAGKQARKKPAASKETDLEVEDTTPRVKRTRVKEPQTKEKKTPVKEPKTNEKKAGVKEPNDKKAGEKERKKKNAGKKLPDNQKSIATLLKEGKTLTTSNCKELKLVHSRAYHSSFSDAKSAGLDADAAKEMARESARIAKDLFIKQHGSPM